jgi:hypothetical protein
MLFFYSSCPLLAETLLLYENSFIANENSELPLFGVSYKPLAKLGVKTDVNDSF